MIRLYEALHLIVTSQPSLVLCHNASISSSPSGSYFPFLLSISTVPDSFAYTLCHCPAGTFTATTAAKKNGTLVPVVRYTVETLANGVWTDKTWYEGASYTYTEGTAPATVRLTWHGHPEGTVIMMR